MPQFRYITTQGNAATVNAGSVAEAMQMAQNRDPSSGVQLIQTPAATPQATQQPQTVSQSVNQPTTQPNLGSVEQQIQNITQQVQGLTSQVGGLKMPDQPQYTGGIGDAQGSLSFYQTLVQEKQKQAEQARKESEERQRKEEEQTRSILDYVRGTPKRMEDYTQQQYANLGIQPAEYFASQQARIAELDNLSQQYNDAVTAKDLALSREQERLAPMSFISSRMTRVERDANIRLSQMAGNINAKTAIMEMEQGNFNSAQNFVNQAVANYTWAQETELNMMMQFRSENIDIIRDLDTKYQNALDQVISLKQDEYNQTYNEKTQVGNLMLQYPNAGITINDTIDTATQKASKRAGTLESMQLAQATGTGTGEVKQTGFGDELINGLNQGVSPQEAARIVFEEYNERGYKISYQDLLAEAIELKANMETSGIEGGTGEEFEVPEITGTPETIQYTPENYKSLGDDMVITPDGRVISKSKVKKDIEENTPDEQFVTTGQSGGGFAKWVKGLFGFK